MKKYFIHSAVFRLLAPLIFGVILYLLILLINNTVGRIYEILSSEEIYICIGLTYLSFEGMRMIILILNKKYSTITYQIPIQILLTTLLSLGVVWVCLSAYFSIIIGFSISNKQLILFLLLFAATSWLYNILFYSNHFLQKENTVKLETERQQHQVLEMEMKEFTKEINPDLLFEGLESLIGLLYQDIEKAEEHIDNLASTYRYVLTNRKQELVTLESEAQSVKPLLAVLNEKFNHKIHFEFPAVDGPIMVVPGSLAIIIEYMVRNTIIPTNEKLIIKGYAEDDDYLAFQCLLNEKLIPHKDSMLALERLQKSYKRFSNNPLIQVKAYKENFIKLPILLLKEETAPIS